MLVDRDQPLLRRRQRGDAGGDDRGRHRQRPAGARRESSASRWSRLGTPPGSAGRIPIDDAAAAALATHPPAPEAAPLEAVTLVPDDDWQAGIAASVLAGPPLRLPVLISQHGAVPDATTQALAQLDPKGGGASGDVAVYSAGGASVPSGLKSREIPGDSPAEIANSIDQLRQRLLKQEPQHILLVSSDQAGYAMPAAAWAARAGRSGPLHRRATRSHRRRWRRCAATPPRPSTSSGPNR